MLRRGFFRLWLIGALAVSARSAAVLVQVAPPAPLMERVLPSPGPGYVWTPGYHRWDGHRYIWVPGRWQLPPRPRARWARAHWVRRHGGWVLVEGHWR